MIQRSPNQTRGRTPWAFSSSGRVSVACSNRAMRVSRQSSLPKKNGELAAMATCGPAIAWAAFQKLANASGSHCWCSCTLVQAASGAIVSANVDEPQGSEVAGRQSVAYFLLPVSMLGMSALVTRR